MEGQAVLPWASSSEWYGPGSLSKELIWPGAKEQRGGLERNYLGLALRVVCERVMNYQRVSHLTEGFAAAEVCHMVTAASGTAGALWGQMWELSFLSPTCFHPWSRNTAAFLNSWIRKADREKLVSLPFSLWGQGAGLTHEQLLQN